MPLNPDQTAIIKATVPILETGGEALTTHFYKLMFSKHPEVRPLFNQTHQAAGTQPRALANAVLCYAKHIEHLDQLPPALVPQIVQKHVSLNILPQHYPIVGSCLLQAIREVLGADVATDAVLEAWGAAYGQLADILIGLEEDLYAAKQAALGGWRGTRAFRVVRKEPEADGIMSFYLQSDDGKPVLRAQPGQYIALRLDIDGKEARRNYSLSDSCAEGGNQYRISVKRHEGGLVSTFLHDTVQVGSVLDVFVPAGEFVLPAETAKPVVLLSAGVGITPTIPMLEAALASPAVPHVYFLHTARQPGQHAFHAHVDALAAKHPNRLTYRCCYTAAAAAADAKPAVDAVEQHGRLDESRLSAWLPAGRDVDAFVLGPKEFMRDMTRSLKALGVPAAQCRVEFFGPAEALA